MASSEVVERIRWAWDKIAKQEGEECLGIDGIEAVLSELGLGQTVKETALPVLIQRLDQTGDGRISLEDFVGGMNSWVAGKGLGEGMEEEEEEEEDYEDEEEYVNENEENDDEEEKEEIDNLSEAQIIQLSSVFDKYDSKGMGELNDTELHDLKESLVGSMPREVHKTLFNELEKVLEGKGQIIKQDFLHVFSRIYTALEHFPRVRGGKNMSSSNTGITQEDTPPSKRRRPRTTSALETKLRKEVKEARGEMLNLRIRNSTILENNERLQVELEEAKHMNQTLSTLVEKQKEVVSEAEEKASVHIKAVDELKILNERMDIQTIAMEELSKAHASLKKANAKMKEDKMVVSNVEEESRHQVEALSQENDRLSNKVKEVTTASRSKEKELQDALASALSQHAEAKDEIVEIQKLVEGTSVIREQLEGDNEALRYKVEALNEELETLRMSSRLSEPIPTLEDEGMSLGDEVGNIQNTEEVQRLNTHMIALKKELELSKGIKEQLEKELELSKGMKEELEELKKELELSKGIKEQLEKELDVSKKKVEEGDVYEKKGVELVSVLEGRVETLTRELDSTTGHNSYLKVQLQTASDQVDTHMASIRDLQLQLRASNDDNKVHLATIHTLTSQIKNHKEGEVEYMKKKGKGDEYEIQLLKEQLQEAREDTESLEKLLHSSEKEKRKLQQLVETNSAFREEVLAGRQRRGPFSWLFCCFPGL